MIPNPFSAQKQLQRTRLLRNRQQLQQNHIKQEHLRDQVTQQNLRRQSTGSFNNYVFKTLGRPPPPPPPRQSHLPGQGSEQAPEGERTPLDYQADFERAKETGEAARSEHAGHETESHKSAHEREHERAAAHREQEVLDPYAQDVFLQPGGNATQQDNRDGDTGSGSQSGGHQPGSDSGGQSRNPQSRALAGRAKSAAPTLDKALQDAIETGLASSDTSVQVATLVSVLGQIVLAGNRLDNRRQTTLLSLIGRHIAEHKDNKAFAMAFATVGTIRAALIAAGFDVAQQAPADRLALLPLQLLNLSRPRTPSQSSLTTERLANADQWLLSRA
ncbi:hypothetical protein [Paracidovorax konjaci]|uniref:Type III secretion regulatory protein HpaA n=1 Tax=Paracidovorax konjaci TaxID=32040 RepID=A0A1I1V3X4_9BURK|nr:hypothetical protein [Paracidovorax konjaci]SFD77741.1 type III secretion regulatory protein HpaA [Paracidovorax konjaci]